MKSLFIVAISISLAALVSSCGSSGPQVSSGLLASSDSTWMDVTTTNGTARSTCEATPANCTMQDMASGLKWSKKFPLTTTWNGATSACANLTHNGQKAGTWHLPSKEQLVAANANGITRAARENWLTLTDMQVYFWSSSSDSSKSGSAWIVNLAVARALPDSKNFSYAVICVQ